MKTRTFFNTLLLALIISAYGYAAYAIISTAYDQPLAMDAAPRNEWGQHLPLDTEDLCAGTILRYTDACLKKEAESASGGRSE